MPTDQSDKLIPETATTWQGSILLQQRVPTLCYLCCMLGHSRPRTDKVPVLLGLRDHAFFLDGFKDTTGIEWDRPL